MIRYNGYVIRKIDLSAQQLTLLGEAGCKVEEVVIPANHVCCRELPNGMMVYDVHLPRGAKIQSPPELARKKEKRTDRHGFVKKRIGKAAWRHGHKMVEAEWMEGEHLLSNPSRFTRLRWAEKDMAVPVD